MRITRLAFSKLTVAIGCLAIFAAMLSGTLSTAGYSIAVTNTILFSTFFASLIVFGSAMGVIAYRERRNKGVGGVASGIRWDYAESIWIATFMLAFVVSIPILLTLHPLSFDGLGMP